MMRNLERYFGIEGPWSEAFHMYKDHTLPLDVFEHAATLGDSRIAFCLGYAFATVLSHRGMRVTRDDLEQISFIKITSGDPSQFVNGFRLHESRSLSV